jgi:hypothetical protein
MSTGNAPRPLRNSGETVLFQIEFETQLSHETRLCPFLDKKSMDANYRYAVNLYFKKEKITSALLHLAENVL